MKKGSLVIKEAVNIRHRNPGRLSHTHNPPNTCTHQDPQQKGYVCNSVDYSSCIHTTISSMTHVYKEKGGKKQAKNQTTSRDCQWRNILLNVTHKHRETKSKSSKTCTQTPTKRKFPSKISNYVTEKNFLWLGVDHNKQYDTRNQSILMYARYIKETKH